MITVGVTSVGGGVGQAVLRSLGYGNLQTRAVGMDIRPMSPGLFWADSAYLVPPAADEEAYIKRLLEICARESIDVLIPGLDVELNPLSRHKDEFLDRGCSVIVSSPEAVQLCWDKQVLYEFCKERNLPFVTTYSLAEAQSRARELTFPQIVKPRSGSGSTDARPLYKVDELLQLAPNNELIVQTYLPPDDSEGDSGGEELWSRKLNQSNEISAQFFVGGSGEILGSFVSVNHLKDGVPDEILPDPASPAVSEGSALIEALAAEGLRGPINIQGRLTSDGIRFFEANARFTGITAVRAALGYREVEAAIHAFMLNQEQEARRCLVYSPGFAASRYVDETIVPVERIAIIRSKKSLQADTSPGIPGRLLVTGASGYIGANLTRRFLDMPEVEEVRAAVRNESAGEGLKAMCGESPRLKVVYGELPASPWSLEGVEVIVHLAALRPDPLQPVNVEEFYLVNSEGTRRLLEAARDAGVARVIYLSTQAVYGTKRPPLWSEALPAQPETPYGLSKWTGELLCRGGSSDGLQAVVLRAARVYGLGHRTRWNEMPHKFALRAAQGQPLLLYASGKERMDFIQVRDLCEAIVKACLLPLPGSGRVVFNIGSGRPLSVAQFASLCQAAAEEAGLPAPAIVGAHGGAPSSIVPAREFGMDIRRARAHLGWAPSVSLKEGIQELVAAATEM